MEEDQQQQDLQRHKKRLLGTATGALAVASLALGALFGGPDELLAVENDEEDASFQASAVSIGKRLTPTAGQPGTQAQPSAADRLRAFFLRQSQGVRAVVLFPMWCVGKVALTALGALFHALSPFGSAILGVLLNALLLAGLFAAVYKLLFPNRSLKRLFQKRNIIAFLVGGLLLGVVDTILKWYYPEYRTLGLCIKAGLGFVAILLLCSRLFRKKRPQKAAA